MDSSLKPVLKRQILVLGASMGTGILVSIFFGFLIGLAANIAVLLGLVFYLRRRHSNARVRLRYVCLACGEEVKGARCAKCGSNMKKPLF